MVALLLQPPLLFFCNVPLLFDDVVIGCTTICYVHLYYYGYKQIYTFVKIGLGQSPCN
jgi:hypothetical protein